MYLDIWCFLVLEPLIVNWFWLFGTWNIWNWVFLSFIITIYSLYDRWVSLRWKGWKIRVQLFQFKLFYFMNLYFLMNLFYWLLFLFACDRNGSFFTWGRYLNWATMFSLSSYFNTLLIFIFGIYNSLNYLFLRLTSIILVLFVNWKSWGSTCWRSKIWLAYWNQKQLSYLWVQYALNILTYQSMYIPMTLLELAWQVCWSLLMLELMRLMQQQMQCRD